MPGRRVRTRRAGTGASDALAQAQAWLDAGPDRVVVHRRDVLDLRTAAPPDGPARAVGLWLEDAPAALPVVPPPTWPRLTRSESRVRPPGVWTALEFAEPVDVAEVVAEVARQAVRPPLTPVVRPVRPAGLDTRVLNPTGFRARVAGPVVDARDLDLRHGATPGLVARLREHAGVLIKRWDDAALGAAPGLAAAGVPLVARNETGGIDPAVLAAMRSPVDLADALAREEHSIVLRRAALDAYAPTSQPAVSILLATRRPEMLDHALGQVARQRGVARLELVLATHGFDADPAAVQEAVGDLQVQLVPQPADAVFGDVLHAASVAAGGEVVMKWDDDDWYAPDAVADLLRARAYSGADLVGMPPETHYVAPADLTVFKGHPQEKWSNFVAGGTMMLDQALLREVGGFRRVRRYVDAQLLESVRAAGGGVYRTHGLGYVLHRTARGHTWQIDLDTLLDPDRMVASRPGLAPSRLLELR